MNHDIFGLILTVFLTILSTTLSKCYYNFNPNQYHVLYNYSCPFAEIVNNYTEVTFSCTNVTVFNVNMLPEVLFSNTTRTLYMLDCKLQNITIDAIRKKLKIKILQEFVLRGCDHLECRIIKNIFEGLNNLQILELSSMKVAKFARDFLANTPQLRKIDLSFNELTEIDFIFNYTLELKVINLNRNKLTSLPENIFSGLSKLSTLFLGYNNIKSLSPKLFIGLCKLQILDLSGNQISTIPSNVFFELISLLVINLSNNNLTHVHSRMFSKNVKLIEIKLTQNPNITLSGEIFARLFNIYYLHLEQCELNDLSPHIFQSLVRIHELYLSKNKLTFLSESLFFNLTDLDNLDLSYNEIEYIPKKLLCNLINVRKLNLQNNKLKIVTKDMFRNVFALEELNLNYNRISVIEPKSFFYLKKLKFLKLTNNNLTHIKLKKYEYIVSDVNNISFNLNKADQYPIFLDDDNFPLNISLKTTGPVHIRIDLSSNKIKYITYIRPEIFEYIVDVIEIMIDELIICDCFTYEYLKDIKKQTNMKKVYTPNVSYNLFEFRKINVMCENYSPTKSVFDLELSNMSCTVDNNTTWCPKNCTCLLKPHDHTMIVNCSYRNLIGFPKLGIRRKQFTDKILNIRHDYNETEVNLEGNYLINGPAENSGYENITSLVLSHNQLESLDWIPPHLKILELDHNNFEELSEATIKMLKNAPSLERLTLFNNTWKCNCAAVELQKLLVLLLKPKVDPDDVICVDTQTPISMENLCQLQLPTILLITAILFIVFTLIIMLAIYYRFEKEIKIYLFSKNLCLWFVTEKDLDQDKEYDVYLCYSHKNEDFVRQKLLPLLEKEPNSYKVCIHLRDWIPGELITTQVIQSVQSSRRTLIVLTKDFIESVWCKMEFRTAHEQAIADGLARVIVVIYGELNKNLLDDELTAYLRTNTYIEWEENQWFEKKLKYALPHSKLKVKGNIESVSY